MNSKDASGWLGAATLDPQNGGNIQVIAGRDGFGRVEIFYCQIVEYRATGAAGAWTLGQSLPDVSNPSTPMSAVAFGAGGEIHAAHLDQGQVRYAYFDGCTWSTQVVDANITAGGDLRVALDSSGAPHFSYRSTAAGTNPAVTISGTLPRLRDAAPLRRARARPRRSGAAFAQSPKSDEAQYGAGAGDDE